MSENESRGRFWVRCSDNLSGSIPLRGVFGLMFFRQKNTLDERECFLFLD
jgi:hypothetical protein